MEEKSSQPPAKLPESEEQEKVIKLLEERLEKHNDNRKAVQCKLIEISNKLRTQIDELEDRINRELMEKFISEDDRLQAALNEFRGNSTTNALQEAKTELSMIQSYEIIENSEANNDLTTLYRLKTEKRTIPEDGSVGLAVSEMNSSTHGLSNSTEMSEIPCGSDKFSEERERLIELLEERLQTHDDNREAAQDKLHDICEGLRAQIDELENRVSRELEEKFTLEDDRLQSALSKLRGNRTTSALQKAKAELLVEQLYEILENKEEEEKEDDDDDEDADEEYDDDENDGMESNSNFTALYKLKAERRIVPELMEMRKPTNIRVTGVSRGCVSVIFTCFNLGEERVLSDRTIVNPVKYKCLLFKKDNEQESKEYSLDKDKDNDSFTFTPDTLESETPYGIRVKMVVGDRESEWSDEIAEFITPEFKECCVWKKCPDYVDDDMKYGVDGNNPRVATKASRDCLCTIIGNTIIPLNKVISWDIKILESWYNDGDGIWIGIAPSDINQNYGNYDGYGWYFDCYSSTLWSGPPHNYNDKAYGPRKESNGEYVHTRDSVGVVMDTTNGDLSFVLNRVNLGVAYKRVPLDKPLVPCVLLREKGDSIELTKINQTKPNTDRYHFN